MDTDFFRNPATLNRECRVSAEWPGRRRPVEHQPVAEEEADAGRNACCDREELQAEEGAILLAQRLCEASNFLFNNTRQLSASVTLTSPDVRSTEARNK